MRDLVVAERWYVCSHESWNWEAESRLVTPRLKRVETWSERLDLDSCCCANES